MSRINYSPISFFTIIAWFAGLVILVSSTAQAEDLFDAAKAGDTTNVETLVAGGADVNAKNSDGYTSLQIAAFYGQKDVADVLIAHQADVNVTGKKGDTALTLAAFKGNKDVVELLLAHNTGINTKNDD